MERKCKTCGKMVTDWWFDQCVRCVAKERDDLRAQLEREKGERERLEVELQRRAKERAQMEENGLARHYHDRAEQAESALAMVKAEFEVFRADFVTMTDSLAAALEEVERLKRLADDRAMQQLHAESQLAAAQLHAEGQWKKGFMSGVGASLVLVDCHGADTIYKEIVQSVGAEDLWDMVDEVDREHLERQGFKPPVIRSEANQPQGEGGRLR